jgi:hypothetical protein
MTPYKPTAWSDRIVISTVPGTSTDAAQFTTGNPLFIDWAVINQGQGDTTVPFKTRLLLNNVTEKSWITNPPLKPDWYTYATDFVIPPLAAGTYTLTVQADYENVVAESHEDNNSYSRTFSVVAPTPSLSISDVVLYEGNSGRRNATFVVNLSAPSTQMVTVAWATANGSARAGSDYLARSGALSFTPGQTSASFTVPVNGDRTPEPDESFLVNLSNPMGATIADGQGVGTILNDDRRAARVPTAQRIPAGFTAAGTANFAGVAVQAAPLVTTLESPIGSADATQALAAYQNRWLAWPRRRAMV